MLTQSFCGKLFSSLSDSSPCAEPCNSWVQSYLLDPNLLVAFAICALQGKQKYTLPLYRAMWSGSESARALAVETFSATASKLHVNVRNYVKKILASEPVGT